MSLNIDFESYSRAPEMDAVLTAVLDAAPWEPDHPDCLCFYNEPVLFLAHVKRRIYLVVSLAQHNLAQVGNDWVFTRLVSPLSRQQAAHLRSGKIDLRTAHHGCEDHVYLTRRYENREGVPVEAARIPGERLPSEWLPDPGVLAV